MRLNKNALKMLANFDVQTKLNVMQLLGVSTEHHITLKGLHNLLRSRRGNSRMREIICSLIMVNGSKSSIGVLIDAFNDKDEAITHMAMLALAIIKSNKALEFLIKTLRSSPDEYSRRSAAYSLAGYRENKQAADALIEALNNKNESSETRAQAAGSLGQIVAVSATDTLLANLHDLSAEVRIECIYALGEVGMDAAIISELEELLDDESLVDGEKVKDKASEAIRYIKRRVKALENYTRDKSTVDIWTLNAEADKLENPR